MRGGSKVDIKPEILSPELQELSRIFTKYSFDLRIAGGAVRDILMKKIPHDIDLATTATPDEMKDMFTKEGVRMINNKGESHGTITPRIFDKENFEVTTLRIDTVTDGRHAKVDFTTDWKVDAGRRDLTINSMFLGLDGSLYDYFDGLSDLNARRLRFVGKPEDRIQEDYLRILRYFRFYGRIASRSDDHDEKVLVAIKENAEGLKNVSGERIWMELSKIIVGRFAPDIIQTMEDCGVLSHCGLPSAPSIKRFREAFDHSGGDKLHPAACLACLMESSEEVKTAILRLRVSKVEADMIGYVFSKWDEIVDVGDDLGYFKKRLLLQGGKSPKMKMILLQAMRVHGISEEVCRTFEIWEQPRFPLNGHVLSREWGIRGPKLGKCLEALRAYWVETDFTATEQDLMSSEMKRKYCDE